MGFVREGGRPQAGGRPRREGAPSGQDCTRPVASRKMSSVGGCRKRQVLVGCEAASVPRSSGGSQLGQGCGVASVSPGTSGSVWGQFGLSQQTRTEAAAGI